MSIEIKMPRLSDTMESGTLVKWYVKEGDEVEADQVIADVETDKATMEMPSYDAGKVAKILVDEGATVNIGELLAVLAEEDEAVDDVAGQFGAAKKEDEEKTPREKPQKNGREDVARAKEPATSGAAVKSGQAKAASTGRDADEEAPGGPAPTTAIAERPGRPAGRPTGERGAADEEREEEEEVGGDEFESAAPGGGGGRMLISPLARRLAEENDLDLRAIKGSGPGGRIVKRDVLAMVEADGGTKRGREQPARAAERRPAPAPAPTPVAPAAVGAESFYQLGQSVKLSNMRQTIARRLVESKQTIPHYQVSVNADAEPLLELRETLNEQLEAQGVKLSINDFIVRACALAIHQHPIVNARWNEAGNQTTLEIGDRVNVGIAIAMPDERGGGLVVATIFDADRKGLRQISSESKGLATKAREKGLTIDEMSNSTFTISNMGMFDVDFFTAVINPPNAAILAVGSALEKAVVRESEIVVGYEMSLTASFDHRIIDGATGAKFMKTLKTMIENPATLLV